MSRESHMSPMRIPHETGHMEVVPSVNVILNKELDIIRIWVFEKKNEYLTQPKQRVLFLVLIILFEENQS